MSILGIKTYPDRILLERTSVVREITPELQKLIDDMIETMYAAPGVGLAANQVGVSQRVLVVDISSREEHVPLITLINPEIVSLEGESTFDEGCLSLPGFSTVLKRAERVTVRGLDRNGKPVEIKGEGLLARALQHEMDHLNGRLLIDRIGRLKKELFMKRHRRQKQ